MNKKIEGAIRKIADDCNISLSAELLEIMGQAYDLGHFMQAGLRDIFLCFGLSSYLDEGETSEELMLALERAWESSQTLESKMEEILLKHGVEYDDFSDPSDYWTIVDVMVDVYEFGRNESKK